MDQIQFYKEYYRAISYFNKGQEKRKKAEAEGSGMGLAAGIIKYAINSLLTAEKSAKDSGTKAACGARMKVFKEELDEVCLQMKNVYYESECDKGTVEKIEFESKNFTIYRSIEP